MSTINNIESLRTKLANDATRRVPLQKDDLKNRLDMINEIKSTLEGDSNFAGKKSDNNDNGKIRFSFNETKPDLGSFGTRFAYFTSLSDPKYFFYGDDDIVAGIKTWRKYEKMAKE